MSEATNKTTEAKAKRTATAAKAVAKSAAEQAAEAKPDAAVKADSKTEGKQSDGVERNQESAALSSDDAHDASGHVGTGDAIPSSNSADNDGVGTADKSNTKSNASQSLDGIKGAFVVTAKTDAGFWRAGIKFKRLEKTLVLVLGEDQELSDDVEIVGYESSQVVCLSAEKAKRIYNEKNLVVTDIDLDELKVK